MGHKDRMLARELSLGRNTCRKYRDAFSELGLLDAGQAMPTLLELQRLLARRRPQVPQDMPALLPYRDELTSLMEHKLDMTVALRRFREQHPDVTVGYTAFRRFIRRYVRPVSPPPILRIETAAGEQAQVDFGYAGLMPAVPEGVPRKTWAFVMTLSFSRHQYVEFVHDQSIATWLGLHRRAFESFGGVPVKVVLDNLKAAITKACANDPLVQRSYREFAEHYDFVISACLPRTPRHKGKVEAGVKYVKRSFLAGQSFTSSMAANAAAAQWVEQVAGQRVHGTTHAQPLVRFEQEEKASLRPLPDVPYEVVEYRVQRLPPDCHVVFDKAFYSAPSTLQGEQVTMGATANSVQIFHEHNLVATHVRARQAGQRCTTLAHFPPEKSRYLVQTPHWCRQRAEQVGPHTSEFVERLLGDRVDRLRGAQSLLRLAEQYGADRLEAACRRALLYDALAVRTVKTILTKKLDLHGHTTGRPVTVRSQPPLFARSFTDLFNPALQADNQGDVSWTTSIN